MRNIVLALSISLALFFSSLLFSADAVEGYWKSIDEKSGEATAYWKFVVSNDTLFGYIVSYPDMKESDTCDKCKGWFKDKPIRNTPWLKLKKRDDTGKWSNGYIIDSGQGSKYNASVWVDKGSLNVRGYVGVEALGRTQVWKKISKSLADKGM